MAARTALDPDEVTKSYLELRTYLIADAQRRHSEAAQAQQALEWREKRPETGEKYLLERLGVDPERTSEWAREKGSVYRKHYAAAVEPRLAETRHHVWVPPTTDPPVLDPRTRQLTPYANLIIASDKSLLSDAPEGVPVSNPLWPPWYELQNNWTNCQGLFIDLWGEGNGLVGLFPAYNSGEWKEVYWFFSVRA